MKGHKKVEFQNFDDSRKIVPKDRLKMFVHISGGIRKIGIAAFKSFDRHLL